MFFYIILAASFFLFYTNVNKNSTKVFLIQYFYIFNFFFLVLLNFKYFLMSNELYIYIYLLIMVKYININNVLIFIICLFIKYDNLLINLLCLELINLIFFNQLQKNLKKIKNVIIYNYILSTLYIFISLYYFYYNFGTLNKSMLMNFEPENLQLFLFLYLFIKMGGLIGYKLQHIFYNYLNYKNLILYTFTNFYAYIYIYNIESIFNYVYINNNLVLITILINFIINFYFKKNIKTQRDFLFFSSQILLNNLMLLMFMLNV